MSCNNCGPCPVCSDSPEAAEVETAKAIARWLDAWGDNGNPTMVMSYREALYDAAAALRAGVWRKT